MSWKPEDHNDVSPYLICDGAERTLTFLEAVFDARRGHRAEGPDGRIRHAEAQVGDSWVMVADGGEGFPPQSAHVHVYVPDVDAAYGRALQAGGVSIQAPVQKDDEDRRAGVRGPGGVSWWIGTRVG